MMKTLFLLAFLPFVQQLARSRHQRIVSQWRVDLDGDGKPESVALLCEKDWGDFIVESGEQRWDVSFPVEGACRPTKTLSYTQQGLTRELGLREGKIVVVRQSVQEDEHEQPSRIDWDVLVKATKAKYPTLPERPRKSTRELVLSPL